MDSQYSARRCRCELERLEWVAKMFRVKALGCVLRSQRPTPMKIKKGYAERVARFILY